jgi:hypothetical protein
VAASPTIASAFRVVVAEAVTRRRVAGGTNAIVRDMHGFGAENGSGPRTPGIAE